MSEKKIYTFRFSFTVDSKEDSTEFCAASLDEAKKLFEEWYKEGVTDSEDIPVCDIEVVYNEGDYAEYGKDYGTPEDYDMLCKYCHPYTDGTYTMEFFVSPDNLVEITVAASEEALRVNVELPDGKSGLLTTAARFCPYCGRSFAKKEEEEK